MNLKLLSCEIFYREMCAAVAKSVNRVDIEFLPKGLHDIGAAGMHERLQREVDHADEGNYEAVLLGYGLCGNGVAGLKARSTPLVVPRAHDCITLFLGSQARYLQYFREYPGTYFKTTGWIERGDGLQQLANDTIQKSTGLGYSYPELVARYGEDNARYLYEQLGDHIRNYSRMVYIETGVEPDDRFEIQTRKEASQRDLKFAKLQGDISMLQRLIDGQWNEQEFLVVPPKCTVTPTHKDDVIELEEDRS